MREKKERFPNIFEEGMNLLEAAYWKGATDKKILGLEKHSAYELVAISSTSPQKVVDT